MMDKVSIFIVGFDDNPIKQSGFIPGVPEPERNLIGVFENCVVGNGNDPAVGIFVWFCLGDVDEKIFIVDDVLWGEACFSIKR
jgi:hypothetical protein